MALLSISLRVAKLGGSNFELLKFANEKNKKTKEKYAYFRNTEGKVLTFQEKFMKRLPKLKEGNKEYKM